MGARLVFKTSVIMVLVTVLWTEATALSSSCTNVLLTMSPCLNYITGNSSTPGSGCCTQLASVVRSQPNCLCDALNGDYSSLGLTINKTRALELPAACNVQAPSISKCNVASPPAGSPTESVESPNSAPSGSGAKTVPSAEAGGSSNGQSNQVTFALLTSLLFVASSASFFNSL